MPETVWICTTNSNYRIYSHRVPIEGYFSWERHTGVSSILNAADGHPTLEALKLVPGIESIHLTGAYEIGVSKGKAFDWGEIEPRIVDIVTAHNSMGEAL